MVAARLVAGRLAAALSRWSLRLCLHVLLQVSLSLRSCRPMMLLHPGAWHRRDLMRHAIWRYIAPSKERNPQLNATSAISPVASLTGSRALGSSPVLSLFSRHRASAGPLEVRFHGVLSNRIIDVRFGRMSLQ